MRQERVALRMSTTQEAVRIRLPKRVRQASVQTAIDGQEVESNFRVPGLLVVTMPRQALGREFALEVCYSLDPPEQQLGVMNDVLQTAQVEQAAAPAARVLAACRCRKICTWSLRRRELAPEMARSAGSPADGWEAAAGDGSTTAGSVDQGQPAGDLAAGGE